MRANPHTMFGAHLVAYSKKSPSSTIAAITWCMSYGMLGDAGMRSMSSGQRRFGSSVVGKTGGSSRLFAGRKLNR